MTDKYYILDENGEPQVCDNLLAWANWFETANRHIAKNDIGIPTWKFWLSKILKIKRWEPIYISTVFLGLDHSFGEGPPLLFETLVFGGKHDQEMNRYSTKKEAMKGHEEIVKMCRR